MNAENRYPHVLLAKTNTVEFNAFKILKTKEALIGVNLKDHPCEEIYKGENELASILFAWGVIRTIIKEGYQAVILFNQYQSAVFFTDRKQK